MHRTETIIRRFPLVARPRPLCGPLAERVAKLRSQVDAARHGGDRVAASAVLNQAALVASDCGLPDVARAWCHRHASLYFAARPLDAAAARSALEPLVNLARLHIRAGDGDTAFHLLDDLYHAVAARTDTTIDGITVPMATLVANASGHDHVRRWLWTVHLSDGTRALTTCGRWHEAHQHLRRSKGVGNRMLDGRQVAIIDHLADGDPDNAMALVHGTAVGEPWEAAVTACLAVLCHHALGDSIKQSTGNMLDRYQQLTIPPSLTVFHLRLGMTAIDLASATDHPAADHVARSLAERTIAAADGYAARDLLSDDRCDSLLTNDQEHQLAGIVDAAGLGRRILPADLSSCVTAAEGVLSRSLATANPSVQCGGIRS